MNTNNPFELFGLTPQLYVDHTELDHAFQKVQSLCHPDKTSCPLEKQAALSLSAKISTLYTDLKTPIGCLNAILKLHNRENIESVSKVVQDMEAMQQVFSMQEELMELKLDSNSEGIATLQKKLNKLISDTESAIMLAHKNNDNTALEKLAVRFSYLFKFKKTNSI